MKIYWAVLLILIGSVSKGFSQSSTPLYIAQKIFSKDTTEDISTFLDSNMKYLLNRSNTYELVFEDFELIDSTDSTAIVSLVYIDSTKEKKNSYLYFDHKQSWKLQDLRVFRLYYIPTFRKILESISDKQIDSVIEIAKKDPTRDLFFRSRQEYQERLKIYRLATATDAELVKYFTENKEDLHSIAAKIFATLADTSEHLKRTSTGDIDFSDQYPEGLQKLMLEKIELESEHFFPGCLNFSITETGDYRVGFIRVPDGKSPPLIDRKRLMMLRKVDDNWFIYRTNWTMD